MAPVKCLTLCSCAIVEDNTADIVQNVEYRSLVLIGLCHLAFWPFNSCCPDVSVTLAPYGSRLCAPRNGPPTNPPSAFLLETVLNKYN